MKADNVCTETYAELERIGGGSFGEVYKVRHKKTGEIFAMKQIVGHSEVSEYSMPLLR